MAQDEPRVLYHSHPCSVAETSIFSPVGFKGNLSLLDIPSFFPGVLTKWKECAKLQRNTLSGSLGQPGVLGVNGSCHGLVEGQFVVRGF